MPLHFHKVTALPGTLQPDSMYYVAPAGQPNAVEIYLTNAAGNAARHVINRAEVQAMIDAAIIGGSGGSTLIVDDIAARNAIGTPDNGTTVLVLNASADPTVNSGAATYIYRSVDTTWYKISEHESLDLSLTWTAISGRPVSTTVEIDEAVANSHVHPNMSQLEKVGEDGNGEFTYDGYHPLARLSTGAW